MLSGDDSLKQELANCVPQAVYPDMDLPWIPKYSSPLYNMTYYLHITYTHLAISRLFIILNIIKILHK
jgi:hypothetical protein